MKVNLNLKKTKKDIENIDIKKTSVSKTSILNSIFKNTEIAEKQNRNFFRESRRL
jgi:hypothetical protein